MSFNPLINRLYASKPHDSNNQKSSQKDKNENSSSQKKLPIPLPMKINYKPIGSAMKYSVSAPVLPSNPIIPPTSTNEPQKIVRQKKNNIIFPLTQEELSDPLLFIDWAEIHDYIYDKVYAINIIRPPCGFANSYDLKIVGYEPSDETDHYFIFSSNGVIEHRIECRDFQSLEDWKLEKQYFNNIQMINDTIAEARDNIKTYTKKLEELNATITLLEVEEKESQENFKMEQKNYEKEKNKVTFLYSRISRLESECQKEYDIILPDWNILRDSFENMKDETYIYLADNKKPDESAFILLKALFTLMKKEPTVRAMKEFLHNGKVVKEILEIDPFQIQLKTCESLEATFASKSELFTYKELDKLPEFLHLLYQYIYSIISYVRCISKLKPYLDQLEQSNKDLEALNKDFEGVEKHYNEVKDQVESHTNKLEKYKKIKEETEKLLEKNTNDDKYLTEFLKPCEVYESIINEMYEFLSNYYSEQFFIDIFTMAIFRSFFFEIPLVLQDDITERYNTILSFYTMPTNPTNYSNLYFTVPLYQKLQANLNLNAIIFLPFHDIIKQYINLLLTTNSNALFCYYIYDPMGVIVQSLYLIYDAQDKEYDERDHIYNVYYKDPTPFQYNKDEMKGYVIESATTLVPINLIPSFQNGDVIILIDVKLPFSLSVQLVLDTYKKRGMSATISQTTFLVSKKTKLYMISKDLYAKSYLYSADQIVYLNCEITRDIWNFTIQHNLWCHFHPGEWSKLHSKYNMLCEKKNHLDNVLTHFFLTENYENVVGEKIENCSNHIYEFKQYYDEYHEFVKRYNDIQDEMKSYTSLSYPLSVLHYSLLNMSKINYLYKYTIWELYEYNVKNFRSNTSPYDDDFVCEILGKFIAYISPMFHDNDRICWELYSSIYYLTKLSPNYNKEFIYLSSDLEDVDTFITNTKCYRYYYVYLYTTMHQILYKNMKTFGTHAHRSSITQINLQETTLNDINTIEFRDWNADELVCIDIFNKNCDRFGYGKNPLQLDDFKLELEKRGIIQSYSIDTKIVTFPPELRDIGWMNRDLWNELGRLEMYWPNLNGIREHMKKHVKKWDQIYTSEKSILHGAELPDPYNKMDDLYQFIILKLIAPVVLSPIIHSKFLHLFQQEKTSYKMLKLPECLLETKESTLTLVYYNPNSPVFQTITNLALENYAVLFHYTVNDAALANLPTIKTFFDYASRMDCWICLDINSNDITKIETLLLQMGSRTLTSKDTKKGNYKCVILIREGLNVHVSPSVLSQSLRLYISEISMLDTYIKLTTDSLDMNILIQSSLPSDFKQTLLIFILLYIPIIYRCNLHLFTYSYPIPTKVLTSIIDELYKLLKDSPEIIEMNGIDVFYELLFNNYLYQSLLCDEHDKYFVTDLYLNYTKEKWIEAVSHFFRIKMNQNTRELTNVSVEKIVELLDKNKATLTNMIESIYGANSVNYYIKLYYGEWSKNFSLLYTSKHRISFASHHTITNYQLKFLQTIIQKLPNVQAPENTSGSTIITRKSKIVSKLSPIDKALFYEINHKHQMTAYILNHMNKFITHFSEGNILTEDDELYIYSLYHNTIPNSFNINNNHTLHDWSNFEMREYRIIKRVLRGNSPSIILLSNYIDPLMVINSYRLEYLRNHPKLKMEDIILYAILTDYENRSYISFGCENGVYVDGCKIKGGIWNDKYKEYELIPFHYMLVHPFNMTKIIQIKVTDDFEEYNSSNMYKCPVYDMNDKTQTPMFYALLPVDDNDMKEFVLNKISIYI